MGLVTGLGLSATGSILLGVFGGLFLDRALHTAPLFLLVGLALGVGAAIYGVYKLLQEELKS
jgi:F0F1-type ATP synthase assembly protein I